MSKAQFRILVVLTVVFGFLGGAVSNLVFHGVPALAQGAAAAVQDEVRAKKFVLVDGDGKTRAELTTAGPYGFGPGLWLYDAAGQERAAMMLFQDRPSLGLYEATGKAIATLKEWQEIASGLFVPSLSLYDSTGNVRASLGVSGDGSPCLTLHGPNLMPRVGLGVWADRGPSLDLYDDTFFLRKRVVVGCIETESKRTGAVTKYPESTLTLFKDNGDVLWQAP